MISIEARVSSKVLRDKDGVTRLQGMQHATHQMLARRVGRRIVGLR
jgi:hypothetical protein